MPNMIYSGHVLKIAVIKGISPINPKYFRLPSRIKKSEKKITLRINLITTSVVPTFFIIISLR